MKEVPPASLKPGLGSGCKPVDEADGFDRLGSQQGRHAAVQRFAQVGRPVAVGRHRVEQRAGMLQDRLQLAERFDLHPGHAHDQRQVIGGIGKGNRCIGPFFLERFVEHQFGFGDQRIGAADGTGGDISGHELLLNS